MAWTGWSDVDELNWAADRDVIRKLKKRGEQPSEWLGSEYRELSERRKAAAQEKKLRAHVERSVALMATQLTAEQCRDIVEILRPQPERWKASR